MEQVLVLDNGYQVHRLEKWTRSIKKVEKKKAEVLSEWVDKKLQTWEDARRCPVVIRLLHVIPYQGQMRGPKFNRKNLWARDRGICQYCGRKMPLSEMELEHVIPKSQGGKRNWTNVVCACTDCNAKKGNRTPEQAGMTLIRKPFIPHVDNKENEILEFLKNLKNITGQEWIDYIYQNIELK
jgi:5-methylcytosine-specific restriction endonuclease McrA